MEPKMQLADLQADRETSRLATAPIDQSHGCPVIAVNSTRCDRGPAAVRWVVLPAAREARPARAGRYRPIDKRGQFFGVAH